MLRFYFPSKEVRPFYRYLLQGSKIFGADSSLSPSLFPTSQSSGVCQSDINSLSLNLLYDKAVEAVLEGKSILQPVSLYWNRVKTRMMGKACPLASSSSVPIAIPASQLHELLPCGVDGVSLLVAIPIGNNKL